MTDPIISPSRRLFGKGNDGGTGEMRPITLREARDLLGLASNSAPNERLFPTLACSEAGAYGSPTVTPWQDANGTARLTKAFYQARFDRMAEVGIDTYVEMYVHGYGSWYFEPSFAYPAGYETGTAQPSNFWWERRSPAEKLVFERFDFLEAGLERTDALGMNHWLGLGHARGDVNLTNDLFNVRIRGQGDPTRFGETLDQRVAAAVESTQQLAEELYERYGHHPSLAGFKFSQETVHFPSSNEFYVECMTGGSGAYPPLSTYQNLGLKIMITPTKLIENYHEGSIDITASDYVREVSSSGADVILMQNNAGNGMNYAVIPPDFAHIPSVEYSYSLSDNFQKYSKRVRRMMELANSRPNLKDRRIAIWGLMEMWRMGKRPVGALSIGPGYGSSGATGVTFSAPGLLAGARDGSNPSGEKSVISSLVGAVQGRATVTDASGAPDSVVAMINRPFSSNSIGSQSWSLYNGYGDPYPMTVSEYSDEIPHGLVLYEKTGIYSWNFLADPAAALQPPQAWNTLADWRSRAQALFSRVASYRDEALERWRGWSPKLLLNDMFYREGPLSGTSPATGTQAYLPQAHNTFCRVKATIHWYRGAGPAGDVTATLRINGYPVQQEKARAGADGGGGTFVLIHEEYPPRGNPFTFDGLLSSPSAAVSDVRVIFEVEEFML